MSFTTPFVKLEVVPAEEPTEAAAQCAQLLAPATYGARQTASRPSVAVPVPRSELEESQNAAVCDEERGKYRKRGRPRKYEGLDEEERRKRRMCVSSCAWT